MIEAKIEFGKETTIATLPALPRVGDGIVCEFSNGIPRVALRVRNVSFRQPGGVELEKKRCPIPFEVVIETEDDPAYTEKNYQDLLDTIPRESD